MSLQLFDSATHELREFRPIKPGQVGIYLCGPTVQSSPHVGHLRSALVYDQLRNWLEHLGFKVTFIRNVTDIDDKVLENARLPPGNASQGSLGIQEGMSKCSVVDLATSKPLLPPEHRITQPTSMQTDNAWRK